MYHYAGNNPINYIDPDGRIVFNLPNHSVTVNLDDREDLERAAAILAEPELGYTKVYAVGLNETIIYTSYSDIMKKLYPDTFNSGFDTQKIEYICSWVGVVLNGAFWISIVVCPCATPVIMGAILVNDSVNLVCRGIDFCEDPTLKNGVNLTFAAFGVGLDILGLKNLSGESSIINSFKINSKGSPYNPFNGRFISYNMASCLIKQELIEDGFKYMFVPFALNFGVDIIDDVVPNAFE